MTEKDNINYPEIFKASLAAKADSVLELRQLKKHTELLALTFFSLVVVTVFQALEVWKDDILPSFSYDKLVGKSPEDHNSFHGNQSLVSVLEGHAQTGIVRLIIYFHLTLLIDLIIRSYFMLIPIKTLTSIRIFKLTIFLSFLIQFGAVGLRIYLLLEYISFWSFFGLLLTFCAIWFTIASYLELSSYFRNISLIVSLYNEIQKKNFEYGKMKKFLKSQNSPNFQSLQNNNNMFEIPFNNNIVNNASSSSSSSSSSYTNNNDYQNITTVPPKSHNTPYDVLSDQISYNQPNLLNYQPKSAFTNQIEKKKN